MCVVPNNPTGRGPASPGDRPTPLAPAPSGQPPSTPPLALTTGPTGHRPVTAEPGPSVTHRSFAISGERTGSQPPPLSTAREIAHAYRIGWPSIPASLFSSVISGSASKGILSLQVAKDAVKYLGNVVGGFACLALNTGIWYLAYKGLLEKSFAQILRANRDHQTPDPEILAARKQAEKYFLGYSLVFNLGQWVAQIVMLANKIDPGTATVLNSAISNALFLSTLPLVTYLCRRSAGLSVDAQRLRE